MAVPERPESVPALERLVAIEEIRQLKARYWEALDGKDWSTMASLFTGDARVDMREEARHHQGHATGEAGDPVDWLLQGGRAVAEFLRGALSEARTIHHGHQPRITIEAPAVASGVWTFYDWLDFGTESFHGYGHYHDEYREVGGEWLISAMVLSRVRVIWVAQ